MKKIVLFILTVALSSLGFGQEVNKRFQDRNFVVKFGLLQPLFNELPFSFEHAFSKNMSYEVTAGLTMSRSGNGIQDNPNFNGGNLGPALQGRKLGVVFQASFRYYVLNKLNAPSGLYISPEIKFRQFRNDYLVYSEVGQESFHETTQTRGLNHLILRFNVGYQFIIKNSFALDLYTGIGFNNRRGTFPDQNFINDPDTNLLILQSAERDLNMVMPHLTFGVRVGVAGKFKSHK